jgi:predicted RNA-binding protein associated with RNAse of E/G family
VIKLNPQGEEQTRYLAEIHASIANGVILDAYWQRPRLDLGYTLFEPGDHFREYFYTDRWFNIFAVASEHGQRKGWYCNVAQPAQISTERIEQVDLLLDVWVRPDGEVLLLDEEEFVAELTLTEFQRHGARQGLHNLLALIDARHEPFQASDFPNNT